MPDSSPDASRGLHDVLGGVRDLVDALQSALDDEQTVERTVQFGGPEDAVDGVVGVRVQTGIAGTAVSVRESVEPTQPSSNEEAPKEVRRPVVDVYDETDRVRIIAEMPGVETEDLELTVEEANFVLAAETDRRRYWRTVSLPRTVVAEAVEVDVTAGLVEIVLPASDANE